jgi:hypothetical protein
VSLQPGIATQELVSPFCVFGVKLFVDVQLRVLLRDNGQLVSFSHLLAAAEQASYRLIERQVLGKLLQHLPHAFLVEEVRRARSRPSFSR